MIDEVIGPEPMVIDDPLDHPMDGKIGRSVDFLSHVIHVDELVVTVTMNIIEDTVIVPPGMSDFYSSLSVLICSSSIVTQTQPLMAAEAANNAPVEVPPIAQQAPPSRGKNSNDSCIRATSSHPAGSSNEAHDQGSTIGKCMQGGIFVPDYIYLSFSLAEHELPTAAVHHAIGASRDDRYPPNHVSSFNLCSR